MTSRSHPPIAYLTGSFPMWSETFIAQEMRLLALAGVDIRTVSVFASGVTPDADTPMPEFLYTAPQTGDAGTSPRLPWLRGGLRWRFGAVRHRHALAVLDGILRASGAGHVHAAFADLPAVLARTAARRRGISWSASVHASDITASLYDDLGMFEDAAFVVVCNRCVYDWIVSRAPALEPRLHLVRHGLVLDDWPVMKTDFAPASPVRLFWAGRLVAKKRPERLLDLVDSANRAGVPCTLTMYGGGPESAGFRNRLASHPARDHVQFRDTVPRSEIARAMEDADVLVFAGAATASGDVEGIPNIIVEAMAVGLPVLSTATGSTGELVDGDTGVVFDADDPASFVDALRGMLGDRPGVASRIGRARARVEAEFDGRTLIQQRVELLENA